jgi:hypothetical protein
MDQINSGVAPKHIQSPPFIGDPFASFPCIEANNRTRIKPEGWVD